jgi:hypothetical protein
MKQMADALRNAQELEKGTNLTLAANAYQVGFI